MRHHPHRAARNAPRRPRATGGAAPRPGRRCIAGALALLLLGCRAPAVAAPSTSPTGRSAPARPPTQAGPAPDPALPPLLGRIDAARIERSVRTLVGFGTRHTLSAQDDPERGIGAARDWIAAELASIAEASGGRLAVEQQSFLQAPAARVPGETRITNVVATLRGEDAPERVVVVSAHYDSRNGDPMDAAGDAPGANDDASGVAVVLELARVLATEPLRATVVLAAVAGEEQGLLGARVLADRLLASGAQVEAMLTNDIVGSSRGPRGQYTPDRLRVFAEGVPSSETAEQARVRQAVGGENDSPARQLARFLQTATEAAPVGVQLQVVHRRDRYLRGGDHIPFLERGVAAVRLTEPHENYDHQHQNVRVEQGRQLGDLPEFCDFDYIAAVTRANAAAVWALARAPAPPEQVRILTQALSYDTVLAWAPSSDPELAGYEIVWRPTDASRWQSTESVGRVTSAQLAVSKDDVFFGVRAVGSNGQRSLVRFPVPQP